MESPSFSPLTTSPLPAGRGTSPGTPDGRYVWVVSSAGTPIPYCCRSRTAVHVAVSPYTHRSCRPAPYRAQSAGPSSGSSETPVSGSPSPQKPHPASHVQYPIGFVQTPPLQKTQDRKSTLLNSSHVANT